VSADQSGRGPAGQPGPAAGSAAAWPLPGGTLDFLAGTWNMVRVILDRRSGRRGRFLGTAVFVPDDGLVRYAEQGELTFGEHTGPASRTLLYSGRDDGGADVRFADGSSFFCLDLRTGGCQAGHQCRADRYQVMVTATGPDSFTETWQVTGPAKDYEMTARYQRAGGEPGPPAALQPL
jgi:hypothetical protein